MREPALRDGSHPSPWARWLGLGGLVPFVVLAALAWLTAPAQRDWAGFALLAYGATIASFLGAIHWGLAMREGHTQRAGSLLWGVLPSLLGWVALLLGGAPGLLLVAGVLALCLAADSLLYPRYQIHGWLSLRRGLTLVACVSCLAGAAALG